MPFFARLGPLNSIFLLFWKGINGVHHLILIFRVSRSWHFHGLSILYLCSKWALFEVYLCPSRDDIYLKLKRYIILMSAEMKK